MGLSKRAAGQHSHIKSGVGRQSLGRTESDIIKPLAKELTQAIRHHWGVESNNWIRDVTFNEDRIKTKAGNQSQIMALLRGLAIELIRKTSPKNFQAAIENFTDSVSTLESMLKQVKFL